MDGQGNTTRMGKKINSAHRLREPMSALTHIIGAVLATAGLIAMLLSAQGTRSVAGALIFGISMILLYSASSIYHGYNGTAKVVRMLRKFDHAMIFVLIAGTYTPICLLTLRGSLGTALLVFIWALAFFGLVFKMFFMHMPKWVSAVMYLVMGWVALFFIAPIRRNLPVEALILLIAGGLLYSAGTIFYTKKSPASRDWRFGFHEVFHIFCILGTAAHFLMIARFVIR